MAVFMIFQAIIPLYKVHNDKRNPVCRDVKLMVAASKPSTLPALHHPVMPCIRPMSTTHRCGVNSAAVLVQSLICAVYNASVDNG